MDHPNQESVESRLNQLRAKFPYWEKTKDLIDQLQDLTLNYRQSGHPGGSRSKVYCPVCTWLSCVTR
jgi:hypothetical protein